MILLGLSLLSYLSAADIASTPGKLEMDPPTLTCLGVMWEIHGDTNINANITLEFRKTGATEWQKAYPLVRAEDGGAPKGLKSPDSYFFKVPVPHNTWRFAGSVVDLEMNTDYELRVRLHDPDGGDDEKVLKARTRAEPDRMGHGRILYAVPPKDGAPMGDGSLERPFLGMRNAEQAASPGDTVCLKPGIYPSFVATKNGTESKPIVWRTAPDEIGEVVIDGAGATCLNADNRSDLTFDGLILRNGVSGIEGNHSTNLTVRYCRMEKIARCMTAKDCRFLYVADCYMESLSTWPRTKGIEPTAGIDMGGTGNTICYNRIKGAADGISTTRGTRTAAVDIYNNEISECTDDGIETDYSDWNVRVFRNRLTNIFQGISCQPVKGGPVYIFRNALYNVEVESFKLHNYGSGILIFHNTTVKAGIPIVVSTPEKCTNAKLFNNLFVGTTGPFAANFGVDMVNSEFDYNALAGEKFDAHIRWSRKPQLPLEQLQISGQVQRHGLFLSTQGDLFATGIKPPANSKAAAPLECNDLRLKSSCPAIDAGLPMAGFNDAKGNLKPDIGAYELGSELPHYGPRKP